MKIINWKNLEVSETPHKVDVRMLYNQESAQAVHIRLEAGEALKPHITPVDVFFYILEGRATVQVGDEKIEVEQDNLVESPKDIVHCLYNNSDKPTRILVVKAPKPTKGTRIL
ncbi:MAG: cupin domain-containing protein [Bacteroidales bacterium]